MKCIQVLLIGVILLGVGLWVYASFLPAYTDTAAKTELDALRGTARITKEEYYKRVADLSTHRNTFLDIASGLLILGITVGLGSKWLQLGRARHWRELPASSKTQVLLWFNGGWIVLFVALYWYYVYRAGRGDYPPFADTIAIPIMQGTAALLYCWPLVNGLLLLALWGAELPGRLGEMPYRYTGRAIVVEVVFGLLALLLALTTVETVVNGDHLTIPVLLVFVYLLVVLRAGHMQAVNQGGSRIAPD